MKSRVCLLIDPVALEAEPILRACATTISRPVYILPTVSIESRYDQ